jgi:hypothetical protein
MKKCFTCNETKPYSEFQKNSKKADGKHINCKSCLSSLKKEDYKNKWFVYQSRLKKSESKKKRLDFNLTPSYLEGIWTEECPVFNKPFVRFDKTNDMSPALDRVDPSKGYVKGNVRYISARANRIKYDASVEELKQVLAYVEGATTIP